MELAIVLIGIVPPFWVGLETENQGLKAYFVNDINLSLAESFEYNLWKTTTRSIKICFSWIIIIILLLIMYVYESMNLLLENSSICIPSQNPSVLQNTFYLRYI